MRRVVVATLNPGKVREFRAALIPAGLEVQGLDALEDKSPVEETGATFEENAKLKAEGYSTRTPLFLLAEDSGIEVDALDGAPGIFSARYGGSDASDADRNRALLLALRGIEPSRRTARFKSVLAVARGGRTLAMFEGVVCGRVLDEPRGDRGFGYDPIFFHPEAGCFGDLSTSEKERWSHRGQAIRAFLAALRAGDPRLCAVE